MKTLCVADTVVKALLDPVGGGPAIADVELLLSCGDLPPEYLTALRARYDAPLLYVLGNHDLRYQSSPPVGCTSVNRRLIVLGGKRILGFSGSRWYNGNMNQYTEEQMVGFIKKLRFTLWRNPGLDVVLTHAPPRHIHDAEDLCHRGFRCFCGFIDKYRPRLFLHGHIHAHFESDEARRTILDSTQVINCYGYHLLEI